MCESDRFGAGSVMVCAGICHDGHTRLKIVQGTLNTVKYRCNILDPIVLSFLLQRNFDHVFHVATTVMLTVVATRGGHTRN